MSRSRLAQWVALTGLVLAAPLAQAQVASALTPLTIRWSGDSTSQTFSFNASNCGGTIPLTWNYFPGGTINPSPTGSLTIWSTSNSCGDSPVTGVDNSSYPQVGYLTMITTRTGAFDLKVSELPGFTKSDGDGGVTIACGATGVELTQRVCASIPPASVVLGTTATPIHASELILTYDTKPPAAPVITASSGLDSSASISFTYETGTNKVYPQYRLLGLDGGDDTWANGNSVTVANTSKVTIDNLENNTTYEVRLIAVDQAGNESVPSDSVQITPIHTVGFFEELRKAGSTEQGGGCSLSGSMLVPLAALGLLRALARRSR